MAEKFIPNGDYQFQTKAESFVRQLAQYPDRYHILPADVQAMADAVSAFAAARQANFNRHTRSSATTAEKDLARAAAVELIRLAAHRIRINPQISSMDKLRIGINERPKRLRRRGQPRTAPQLYFVAGVAETYSSPGVHQIRFRDASEMISSGKPADAVRLELFVDLVPAGEPIPAYPGQRTGMTWYLRSYTRSPIRVEYPQSDMPARVVYWGRWANATGETGPFSRTLVAPIDATRWAHLALPAADSAGTGQKRLAQKVTITTARRELPDCVETIDRVEAESTHLLPDQSADAA
jgi:hypothetical protein